VRVMVRWPQGSDSGAPKSTSDWERWWPGARTIESSRGRPKMQEPAHTSCTYGHPSNRLRTAEDRHAIPGGGDPRWERLAWTSARAPANGLLL